MNKTIIILPLLLSGCIAGQRSDNTGGTVTQPGPIINIPPNQTVDTSGIEKRIGDQITASSNTTQNQMSGLLTASVSKLGEKVTGLEANLSDLIKLNATMNNTASAEIKTKLETTLAAHIELKAEMKNMVDITSKIETHLTAITDIRIALDRMTNQANAQVGWNNKFESKIEDVKQTFTSQAGRDVNMLPQQAVDVIIGSWEFFATLISIILAAATTVISRAYKLAREKAERDFQLERQEKQNIHKLLLAALAHCPADKARELEGKINS